MSDVNQELQNWIYNYIIDNPVSSPDTEYAITTGVSAETLSQRLNGTYEIPPWKHLSTIQQTLDELETTKQIVGIRSKNRFAKDYFRAGFKFEADEELSSCVYYYIEKNTGIMRYALFDSENDLVKMASIDAIEQVLDQLLSTHKIHYSVDAVNHRDRTQVFAGPPDLNSSELKETEQKKKTRWFRKGTTN